MPELFGVAQIFHLPVFKDISSIKKILKSENLIFECIREVPINKSVLGEMLESLPKINQIFITQFQKILIKIDLNHVCFKLERK